MAITINTNPGAGSSLQDDLWHVATSTNAAVPDMKYIFEVYINGSKKISVRQFPDPTNGKSYFDASGTIKSTMTYAWFEPLASAYGYEPNVSGEVGQTYEIRVGEEVSGIATLNMASGVTNVYNYTAPFFKRRVNGIGTMLNKWLTNRPLVINTQLGGNVYIPYYSDEILQLKVNTYDYSNTLVQTATGATNNIDHSFVQMNIGSAAIAAELSVTINDNIKYYDVWFNSFDKIRVYLPIDPALDLTTLQIGTAVSFNFTTGKIIAFSTTALAVKVLAVDPAGLVSSYDSGTGNVTWIAGAVAEVEI